MRKLLIIIFGILFVLILSVLSCKKDDDFVDTLPSCSTDPIFTHFCLDIENVINFEPLGHYNPPGHVFPSDHHLFNFDHGLGNMPVYSPCDGWITYVTENQLPPPIDKEYTIVIDVCKEVKIKMGHISRLDESIINNLGEITDTESYTTGGETYNLNIYSPQIEVEAGQIIAELIDSPEVQGMNFGMIDSRVTLPFVNPDRWNNEGYISTVSFLNYATPEIRNQIFNIIQNDNGNNFLTRNTPPIEGEICYDVAGTSQGIWFLPGEPSNPEDPHLGLIRHNFYPEKNVIVMGESVPGLLPTSYEYYPEISGFHNRSFEDITSDGNIYTFDGFSNFWGLPIGELAFPTDYIILIQLIDNETLRIEQQTINDGPPWSFTTNSVDFSR